MAKRKINKKSDASSRTLAYVAWTLAIVALTLGAFATGYYFGYSEGKQKATKHSKPVKKKRLAILKKLDEPVQVQTQSVNKRLKEVLKKEITQQYISASHEVDDGSLNDEPAISKRKIVVASSSKPMLAIIIDDVGTKSQVEAIKSLKLPLTMSFLPPSKYRPNTPKLAAKENFYMVHLPMEAQNFNAEEPYTLRVSDTQKAILKRVREIKMLFPNVGYINNHTGSKFTSTEVAMNRLIYALNENKILFVDSRTTAKTTAPKVLKNFGLKYVARDVFLDHHMEKDYILQQIKKAIKVAKAHGTAIAIGHPHKNTLQALYESKKLFKDVRLVLINKIY